MKEYTLNDIAQMKESTPQEIIDYLQSKGYAFTKSPDQPLTPSEIKLIDPILFFKLQHVLRIQRPKTQETEEIQTDIREQETSSSKTGSKIKLIKASKTLNVGMHELVDICNRLGHPVALDPNERLPHDLYMRIAQEVHPDMPTEGIEHNSDSTKQQENTSSNQKKDKPTSKKFHFDDILLDDNNNIEYIGIVHFYDDYKNHFGYLGTNDLCPRQSIRFSKDVIEGRTPTDSSIVSFNYKSETGTISAIKTLSLSSLINWKIALRYIGHYADITGVTRSGESRDIHDVLGRLISLTNGYGLWDILLELVDILNDNPKRQKQFIDEYLSHHLVYEIVSKKVAQIYEGAYSRAFVLWQEAVAQKYLEQHDVDKFLQLRDLNPNIPIPARHYDDLRYILFARYGDVSALDAIQDEDSKDANIAEAIQTLPTSEQEARLRLLPNEDFERIVFKHLQGSELHRRLLEERWNEEKANMPYLVFDIESDGTEVTEFAFNTEDNFRSYSGEKQLRVLGRRIADVPIVVGHNIRVWDLPILEKKGFETDAFIWDTLEMEILLNPCRYAYSLHTEHNALADTELTNKLFWNQLYRLSKDKRLCEELKDFLPKETEAIIQALQKPEYEVLFEEEAANDVQFFQELISPEDSLIEALQGINALPEAEQTLLIAPKDLWPRIAQYISLAFPKHDDSIKWQAIDPQLVESNTDLTTFQKCVLRRFIQCSETPIIANIPQYVRSQKKEKKEELIQGLAQIDLSILADCAQEPQSHIECIDIDAFGEEHIQQQDYQHIFIIGSEMQDRTHKCQLGEPYSFSTLISRHSKLPLMMASTNYCQVPDAEIVKLGLQRPSHTANIWAERMAGGHIALYHNYEYQVYRREFLKHFKVTPEIIDWQFANEQINKKSIILVSTEHKSDFDASTYRMTPKTTQRTKYWAYQIALLQHVHNDNQEIPIIYVVNDLDEQEALSRYASSLGFYIPEEGTSFSKLEYIHKHPNGLIIVSKDEFVNTIGEYRTDKSYCYIWDNMDVDRYKLMWRTLPFKDDIEDIEATEPDERSTGSTAKQCILAEWPIFEHYYSLISANSRDSKFYILEPSFDEYNDIADLCQCSCIAVHPWKKKEAYLRTVEEATEFFDDGHAGELDIQVAEAMNIIKNAFLDEGKDWYPYQKEILPHILERKEDCIVSIPTGGGKSVLFQGPAIYRSSYTRKLSLVITPLKALMQDQVEELQYRKGFVNNVDYLSGDRLYAEVLQIYRRIASGEIALLYVTPERFRVRSFIDVLEQRLKMDNGLEYVIFDEAHCIAQWGQDFRPDYRNALTTCMELKKHYPFTLAFFSATITSQVRDDISKFVPDIHRYGQAPEDYNPIRSHIGIEFKTCVQEDVSRVQAIVDFIQEKQVDFNKSRMIIFCRTHKQCEETAGAIEEICANSVSPLLTDCSGHIGYFHAGLDAEQRNDIYTQFKNGGKDGYYILCATKAFGMGMDIPNIHYVVHYSPPSVMEDFLQEVGRAGRDQKMYEEAFAEGHQIPAVCMVSPEDFAKLKDLLIRSLLSWSDLKNARSAAVDFIKRFQSIEKTKSTPIILPYSFWQKDDTEEQKVSNTTAAKLAIHWLEHIGYIQQGYIGQAYLAVTRYGDGENQPMRIGYNQMKVNPATEKVWRYIQKIVPERETPSLVSILQMKNALRMSTPKIFDAIIECQKRNYLTLNDTMRSSIRPRRFLETNYMLEQNQNIFALHIVMNGVRELLKGCKMDEECIFGPKERKNICEHLLDNVHYDLVIERKTKKDKPIEEIQYMPWKNNSSAPKGAVTKAETFAKNIRTRAGYRIFSILDFIPAVRHRTIKKEDGIWDLIIVKNDWRSYVDTFENDCLKWLKHVANHSETAFEWPKAMLDNELDASQGKGFSYFDKILTTLKILSYTDNSPIIQTGVEVYTTPKTMDEWDTGETANSPIKAIREEFDDQQRLKIIRLAAMNIFSELERDKQAEYIHRYFLCRNYSEFMEFIGDYVPEDSDIISQLKEEVLRKEEAKLENNEEQQTIYSADKTENVNVLAGPGSGKTYVLTLRCAKLIYREAVNPRQILVLAYNRAVVAELRNRLDTLFVKLGMSRVAHQLHVHTFHALAKIVMGTKLDNVPPEEWERMFFEHLQKPRNGFKTMFPGIRYIMVDEFQDITQNRLNILFRLLDLYPAARLFTIGDINQSIYGFDRVEKPFYGTPEQYAESLSPQPYYNALDEKLHPHQMTMFTNYRSYQKILDAAKVFLPADQNMPRSDSSLMEHEPQDPYVKITDSTQKDSSKWFEDILSLIQWARKENRTGIDHRHISTIAVFFRKNNEVYRGYAKIKKRIDPDIRIRIQGANNSELWREREIFHVLKYLRDQAKQPIIISDDATQNELKKYITNLMQQHPKWDQEYLDICYTLILNYLDSIRSNENSYTYAEMADEVQDMAGRDDSGQIYKIYDQYKEERLIKEENISLILTTMHKVKGLEFDAVMITPSSASLPLVAHREFDDDESVMADDKADIDEERRLLFVAYTRAKKYLHVYKWRREKAIEKYRLFPAIEDAKLGVTEKEAVLGNYYLSYTALSENFKHNQYILDSVKKDDEVILQSDQYGNLYIVHNHNYIGRLSSRSSILQQTKGTGISQLKGFFISDVFVWTYQDSLEYDAKNNTNFTERWCPEAIKQGYVVLVQIAGFGKR